MDELEFAHNTEVPLLKYNNETELAAIVNLVYLSARDYYRVEREDKAGIGYVDFIFYPETNMSADCIILELKIDGMNIQSIQEHRLNYVPAYLRNIFCTIVQKPEALSLNLSEA